MKTILVTVEKQTPNKKIIEQAAEILKNSGLVAFPTETVYGLGANGLNTQACKKIYEAQGCPRDAPLLHIFFCKPVYLDR